MLLFFACECDLHVVCICTPLALAHWAQGDGSKQSAGFALYTEVNEKYCYLFSNLMNFIMKGSN
ncbi:hypothetical protein C1646_725435 [Rhizophagus diaphanus]|nr:hypothetical protein C1646_725435 [Rhizophagus diaphanus] [Rhizophagus sp. MUCL 43196]